MELHPLAMLGTYFASPISSFIAEGIALEECTSYIRSIMQRDGNPFGSDQHPAVR